MDPDAVVRIGREALLLTLLISAPPVAAALLTGLVVGLIQAATQLQEQSLTFVPKIVAVAAVLACCGLWMLRHVVQFATELLSRIQDISG